MEEYIKWAKVFISTTKADIETEFHFHPTEDQNVKDFRDGIICGMQYLMERLNRFDKDKPVKPQNNA